MKYTEHLRVKEKKTGNVRKIKMAAALKQEIEKYTRGMADSDYLFPYKKGTVQLGEKRLLGLLTRQPKPVVWKDRLERI